MNGTNTLVERPATPGDIIAWLQADYHLRAGCDPEVDFGYTFTADTTIEEWRLTCDLIGTRRLAAVMNEWFSTSRPRAEWQRVLEPEHVRTLGELAAYAAPYVRLPDFRPLRIAGVEDAAAGAFFCLRQLLARTDPRASRFRPSTRVSAVLGRSALSLGEALVRLAPRVTPQPTVVESSRQRIGGALIGEGLLCFLLGSLTGSARLVVIGPMLVLVGFWLSSGPPERIDLAPYETLGDLARAIAGSP
jgi:hypothetical protein